MELRPEAHRALVAGAHAPRCAWPAETLTALFAASVTRSPEATALIAGARRLSYAALMDLSQAIARRLRGLGVGRDAVVAVVMPKCWQQVPAALGVLLAGAAYLPIDAGQPAERGGFGKLPRNRSRGAGEHAGDGRPVLQIAGCFQNISGIRVAGAGNGDHILTGVGAGARHDAEGGNLHGWNHEDFEAQLFGGGIDDQTVRHARRAIT